MKKWADFFSAEPPPGHDEKVFKAVAQSLQDNRRSQPRWFNWKSLSLVSGSLAAILIWVWRQNIVQEEQVEVAAFETLIDPGNVAESTEDLALMSDDSFDLEFLEDLEMIEQMEDV